MLPSLFLFQAKGTFQVKSLSRWRRLDGWKSGGEGGKLVANWWKPETLKLTQTAATRLRSLSALSPLCEPVGLEHDSHRSSSRGLRSDISCAEDFLRTAFPWRRCSKLRPSSHNPHSTFYIFLYFFFLFIYLFFLFCCSFLKRHKSSHKTFPRLPLSQAP